MKTTTDFTQIRDQNSTKLLHLYDDFAEFDTYCAFFCDAVSALSNNPDDLLDKTSAQGLRLFASWLKERSRELKGELKASWEKTASC